ncbi:MAG: excinuclease ABC subunit A [Lactobacillaceae bacterium]|jgi:DNA polymerase V|nr:excinuclease ABC subunit A [Lactobacillaceae bacterium]
MYDYRFEEQNRVNFIVDMRSFYASLEIQSLGLDLLTTPLVVVSKRENDGSGLVMSASPAAKKIFGIKNVMRARELPRDSKLLIAEPRMEYYIQKNLQINEIFNRYAAFEQIYPYSIDESLIDMTYSWKLFGINYREVASKIQTDIKKEIGINATIGIAPTLSLAKIALDIEAKNNVDHIAEWDFSQVPNKLWNISNLNQVWSIGKNTATKLNAMGIFNMYDLAHTDPQKLIKEFKSRGATLFALAWGVDRSIINQEKKSKEHGIGNSQVLPKDYSNKQEIELIIREITDHIIMRVRKRNTQINLISISGKYSMNVGGKFGKQKKLNHHTINRNEIIAEIISLFKQVWNGKPVRIINIYVGGLKTINYEQGNLFESFKEEEKENEQQKIINSIQAKFGFKSIFRASSKLEAGTALYRAGLVGGHKAKK